MEEFTASNFKEFSEYIDQFQSTRAYLFRGQSKFIWKLIPKAGRDDFMKSFKHGLSEEDSFDSFKRYALQFIKIEPKNDLDWYILAQHHGLATRLLDWTKNPLTSLYFSVANSPKHDGAVFAWPNTSKYNLNDLDKFNPFNVRDIKVIWPKSISPRIVSQRSIFTISEKPSTPYEDLLYEKKIHKIKIIKEAKKEILETLDYYGINQMSIFQDLDNLSSYINRYGKMISKL